MPTPVSPPALSPWRLSVAPMIDWTDRHCRFFHRLLTKNTRLYTEMVNAGAIVHGGTDRHLRYNAEEHPVALQLGGSEPALLAQAAKLAQEYQYDEINLNCGCPSERVQRGAFGACLMREPALVADCIKAMQDVVSVPVTVKHRIGIDKDESYDLLRDFVGTLAATGCQVFIVHARNAWLKGLSPKENREVPPLRYEMVYRLKTDFPDLTIVINGGIKTDVEISEHLQQLDGAMLGREAYHNPWLMQRWDESYFNAPASTLTVDAVEEAMIAYMEREWQKHQTPWPAIARHMLGLRHGQRGARIWRQVWSDHKLKETSPHEVSKTARAALEPG